VRFALLFGSRASGQARPASDWDLAVYLDDALSSEARFAFRRDLIAELRPAIAVDLIVLNDAPPLLAAAALRGERLLVRDPTAFARFFVKTLGLAEDDRHFARIHAAARRERLREGRFGRPRGL
jgi:predicted nucleotidyltransferase